MSILHRILNLKLRIKLLLAFGSLLLLNVFMMLKAFDTMSESKQYQSETLMIDGLYINILEMERAAKVFTYEGFKSSEFQKDGKSDLLSSYFLNLDTARIRLAALKASLQHKDSSLLRIEKKVIAGEKQFKNLLLLLRQRGFKDFGLEGNLRAAIHKVENSSYAYDKVNMLTLRRHEKDFFLRRDLKYLNEFNKKADEFLSSLKQQKSSTERDEIITQITDYRNLFNEVVLVDEKIGLQDTGLKEVINQNFNELKKQTLALSTAITFDKNRYEQTSSIVLLVLFVIQLLAGIALAIFYAHQITQSVKELQRAIRDFADGIFPAPLTVRSHEEIGKTKAAFNQLLERIKSAQDFSVALGEGKLDKSYQQEFKDDLLAQALIKTQSELKRADDEQKIINWTNRGAAQLNEILKAQGKDLSSLGDEIIKLLVQYLNVNQGALYNVRSDERGTWAERISTFAYGKRKLIDQRIEAGSGLVGQCILEKSTIIITDVPNGYVKITSGLGEATPKFILITPLIAKDQVIGIVELASFHKLETYQIEFVESIAKNIAIILNDKKSTLETQKLLDESRHYAQQLASQEEEIRQNAEEMHAITEQLEREKKQLLEEIDVLRKLVKADLAEN